MGNARIVKDQRDSQIASNVMDRTGVVITVVVNGRSNFLASCAETTQNRNIFSVYFKYIENIT